MIRSAMILAAGRGHRLRPLTDTVPKPLIPVAGRSMLDRAMDRLSEHGVRNLVINVHHLGEQIARHVGAGRAHIVHEDRLLETGGSVKNALPLLGDEPFFVLNGDGLWSDGPVPMLKRLESAWDPARMDALLLLHPLALAI
ncbi:MAG: sugar phosphate nucleotidyltransferase, partial [Reyranellales bacterium]